MNRKIKFRAWDKERQIMIGVDYPKNWAQDKDEWWADWAYMEITGITDMSKRERFALMEFTGLLDRDDKPIYEGDILEHHDTYQRPLYTVVQFEITPKLNEAVWRIPSRYPDPPLLKVVGNIYETPGLVPQSILI